MTVLLKISVDVISKLSGKYEALGKIASVRMKNRDWVCSGKQPHELHQVWQPSLANSKYIIKLMVFFEDISSNSTSRSLNPTPSTQWSSGPWLVSTSTSSIPYFLLLIFLIKTGNLNFTEAKMFGRNSANIQFFTLPRKTNSSNQAVKVEREEFRRVDKRLGVTEW